MNKSIHTQIKHNQAIYNCLKLVHNKLLILEKTPINTKHDNLIKGSTLVLGTTIIELENQILKLRLKTYKNTLMSKNKRH